MAEASTIQQYSHLNRHTSWNTGKDEVICLCHTRENNILTGHESFVIAWSVDVKTKLFCATQTATTLSIDGSVTCIRQFPLSSLLALSASKTVFVYDYTISNGTIASLTQKDQFCFNTDEINEIDIHAKESYICACDDNGEVKIIDLDNRKLLRTLSRFHDSICSAVKFNSRKPWELISAGLDTKIGRWEWSRGRLLTGVTARGDISKSGLMINPPMVHCMVLLQRQNCIVCGLGDGRLLIYSIKSPRCVELVCESQVHISSIACVCCVEGNPTSCDKLSSCVVSVGNDNTICVLTIDSNKDLSSYEIKRTSKLAGIAKVNGVNVLRDNSDNNFMIFTADVNGTVSVYNYNF